MSDAGKWGRADDLAHRWDVVWDALEDAYSLINDSFNEKSAWLSELEKRVEEEVDREDFDLESHILLLSEIASKQVDYWMKEAEKRGSQMLAVSRRLPGERLTNDLQPPTEERNQ